MTWPDGRWVLMKKREPVLFRRRHLPTQRDVAGVPEDFDNADRFVPAVGSLPYLDPVYSTESVPEAWRRPLTDAELEASEGKYVASDVSWHVPKKFLNQGPALGDIIVDRDGTEYTVLDRDEKGALDNWRSFCRNFVLVFNLLQEIDIERPEIQYDESGVARKLFPPLGGKKIYEAIRCSVQLMSQDIMDERGVSSFEGAYHIHVQRQISVTKEDRVKFGGLYFDIVSYENPERIDELPLLVVAQKV